MKEVDASQSDERSKVVCAWCGGVIRHAAAKPTQRMCQSCFARMMSEHSRAHRLQDARRGASDR